MTNIKIYDCENGENWIEVNQTETPSDNLSIDLNIGEAPDLYTLYFSRNDAIELVKFIKKELNIKPSDLA